MARTEKISEHVLWDNLKREANTHLRKIEALPLVEKVAVFEKPPFSKIQDLLTTIGKELSRIVLHQVIKETLEAKNTELSAKIIDDVLADFSFFFFPGYTTQDKKHRIFIEGMKTKEYIKQRRFFGGIGYQKLRLQEDILKQNNIDLFREFLRGNLTRPNGLFKFDRLYYTDNPSTLAYNLALNKFYYTNDYPKDELPFQAGSTHFWKSQQTYKGQYFPFKLKSDQSELRILHIGTKQANEFSASNGKNKFSLLINKNELNQAGNIIGKYLHKDRIPISWDAPEYKEAYINWSYSVVNPVNLNGFNISRQQLQKAQNSVYSYWLSETFKGESMEMDYSKIKKDLEDMGYSYIAQNRIKTYQEYLSENPDSRKNIYEIYFNNWYTLFLESHGPSANLGTIMLFTNHRLSSDFLIFCSNLIRGIYNELRLIETISLRQIKDFRSINHHHNKIINAFRYYVDGIFENDEKPSKDILTYYINLIEGFMNVEEMIQTRPSDLMTESEINLVNEVKNMISVYKYFTKNYSRFAYLFGKIKIDEVHFKAYTDLKFLTLHIPEGIDNFTIHYYTPIFQLLLKDLIENVIVHSKPGKPKSEIVFHPIDQEHKAITIEFKTNNWPNERILTKMNMNSFGDLNKGWSTINNIIKTANAYSKKFKLDLVFPQSIPENLKDSDFFSIKLTIRDDTD